MRLLLFGTDHCHLCDEAESLIYRSLEGQEYELIKVDISESDTLMNKYALLIPVLAIESNNLPSLKWPFSEVDIIDFISGSA